jgi:hypothetical protein
MSGVLPWTPALEYSMQYRAAERHWSSAKSSRRFLVDQESQICLAERTIGKHMVMNGTKVMNGDESHKNLEFRTDGDEWWLLVVNWD